MSGNILWGSKAIKAQPGAEWEVRQSRDQETSSSRSGLCRERTSFEEFQIHRSFLNTRDTTPHELLHVAVSARPVYVASVGIFCSAY